MFPGLMEDRQVTDRNVYQSEALYCFIILFSSVVPHYLSVPLRYPY